MIAGIFLMMGNLLVSLKRGQTAAADPWGGVTLEWTTASPPPLHNFETDPDVPEYPYDFSKVTAAGPGNVLSGRSISGKTSSGKTSSGQPMDPEAEK